jgi:hypothetical protein
VTGRRFGSVGYSAGLNAGRTPFCASSLAPRSLLFL